MNASGQAIAELVNVKSDVRAGVGGTSTEDVEVDAEFAEGWRYGGERESALKPVHVAHQKATRTAKSREQTDILHATVEYMKRNG